MTKLRALIVDNEALVGIFLKALLKTYAIESDATETGNLALRSFMEALNKDVPYQLIFLDVQISGMDGFELLIRMREAEEERGVLTEDRAVIFIVIGEYEVESVFWSANQECDGYLKKPISSEWLVRKLSDLNVI